MERHCTRCHGGSEPKDGLNLELAEQVSVNWYEITEEMSSGAMPKGGITSVCDWELALFAAWVDEGKAID